MCAFDIHGYTLVSVAKLLERHFKLATVCESKDQAIHETKKALRPRILFWEDFYMLTITTGARSEFSRWFRRNNHFCLNAIACQPEMNIFSRHVCLRYPWLPFNECLQCVSVDSESHIPSPRCSFSLSSSRQCTKFHFP